MKRQLDRFLLKKPALGKGVYIARGAVVLGDVTLGHHSSVWCNAVLRGDLNRIVVGHHTNIQDNAVLHLADDRLCIVGHYVTIGHSAVVHACTIGDQVLVYSRELICGMNTGVDRGATGQMSALAGGSKSAVTRGESFKLDRSLFC